MGAEDIRLQLPEEAKKFDAIDKAFKQARATYSTTMRFSQRRATTLFFWIFSDQEEENNVKSVTSVDAAALMQNAFSSALDLVRRATSVV